jgi:hypothetical protein
MDAPLSGCTSPLVARERATERTSGTFDTEMLHILFIAPLVLALVAPALVPILHARFRWTIPAAFVPACLVVLAALASAPTHWGHAKAAGSDDFTNTGDLALLVLYALVAGAIGLLVAIVVWGGSRWLRNDAA